MSVYSFAGRGFNTMVSTAFEHDLLNSACTYCGQCADVCPTGAIVEKDDTDKVWDAINNPEKVVVVQTAPSVRVALGEELGIPAGQVVTGKMVAALRHLALTRFLIQTSLPTLLLWRKATSSCSACRTVACCR